MALGYKGSVVLWEPLSATELHTLSVGEGALVVDVAFVVVAGRFLLVTGVSSPADGSHVLCWDLASFDLCAKADLTQFQGEDSFRMRLCLAASEPLLLIFPGDQGSQRQLQLWAIGSSSLENRGSTKIPKGSRCIDAAFVQEGHVFCWTSSFELWSYDFKGDAVLKADVDQTLDRMEVDETEAGILKRVYGGQDVESSISTAQKILDLKFRTTPAQQAGLEARYLSKILPMHAQSHLLPPPKVLWSQLISVFGKQMTVSDTTEAESVTTAQQDLGAVKSSNSAPASAVPILGEIVEASWMDDIVKDNCCK